MKTDLSSKIQLDRVSTKYYNPSNDIDMAEVTRCEKISTKIFESVHCGSKYAAKRVAQAINKAVNLKGKCNISLGLGRGMEGIYKELITLYEEKAVSFENVNVFASTGFLNTDGEKTLNTVAKLNEVILSKVNVSPENIYSFDIISSKEDVYETCRNYEAEIAKAGGLDLVLCEIGQLGNLALNEPGSQISSSARLMLLSEQSRSLVKSVFGTSEAPTVALTLGISNILSAKKIVATAWGEAISEVIKDAIENTIDENIPASSLQKHQNIRLVLDLSAAEKLTRISKPWLVSSCEWNDKLIRRAIVWLSQKISKPILKLTNKDYNENNLSELVALYGSAYNVNIKVFNELQHTITGWPGGKPDADDTYRPERANPYPKRVIIFSPHPDDDVISMGGTFKRLVDQKHDVHVAYETSGNIAVGDEDMYRYIMLMDKIAKDFGIDTPTYLQKSVEIAEAVQNKVPGAMDTADVRYLKGYIRQCEATIACKHVGIDDEHIHFLSLPFYETGAIKKGDLSQADVDIVKKLIQEVKPHQIFVAGDLADPHGTHKVCTDAVFAAVDDCLEEDWMKECRIWMYRGAWAEWEMDHVEMAVPISPEELRFKRNSILKHQSQMENAPFLGNDDRLFWQRAEERNRATAQTYSDLGLASYEAMEAFVEYHPIRE
ncbi:MAG: PIG-L family deacetylase [Bacteroidales bacterium]